MHVNDLLKIAVESGASDLHLKVGSYPMMRLRGALTPAAEDSRLAHEDMVATVEVVLKPGHREKFASHHEVDLAYSSLAPAASGATRFNSAAPSGWCSASFPPKWRRSTS